MKAFQFVSLLAAPSVAAHLSNTQTRHLVSTGCDQGSHSQDVRSLFEDKPTCGQVYSDLHLGLLDKSYFKNVGTAVNDKFERVESDVPSVVPLPVAIELSHSPSDVPSSIPSSQPSAIPSSAPTSVPTLSPSAAPSNMPSDAPSSVPSLLPSDYPSAAPSNIPSDAPSSVPSLLPSNYPSAVPSNLPSAVTSQQPSGVPSVAPSIVTSDFPSSAPSAIPSQKPSFVSTNSPTDAASDASDVPSQVPSVSLSDVPSSSPSLVLELIGETLEPTMIPTTTPIELGETAEPTMIPTRMPIEFSLDNFYSCSGSIEEEFTDVVELTVNYEYRLQLDVTTTDESTDINDIVESIEQQVLEAALEGTCTDIDARRRLQEDTLAASASPADYPYQSCGQYCYNIQGAMAFKMTASDPSQIASVYCGSLEAIHLLFDSGELLSIPDVQAASWVYNGESNICNFADSSGTPVSGLEEAGESDNGSSSSNSAQIFVAIGAFGLAAAFLILGGVIIGRVKLAERMANGDDKLMPLQTNSSDEESAVIRQNESGDSKSLGLLRGWEQDGTAQQRRPSNSSKSGNWDPIATLGFSEIDMKDESSLPSITTSLNDEK
jgi:hypothetical protein